MSDADPTVEVQPESPAAEELEATNAVDLPEAEGEEAVDDDGRTRCAWIRPYPEHYFFYDAEYGRMPDSDPACFERVLMACFAKGGSLIDVLNQRLDIYEFSGEWDVDAVASADDGALSQQTQRDGIFADGKRLKWIRDVAKVCQETAKDYKGLREYFLNQRWLMPEERLLEVCQRFPGFEREDAADLLQLMGSVDDFSWGRDSWVYPDRRG